MKPKIFITLALIFAAGLGIAQGKTENAASGKINVIEENSVVMNGNLSIMS